MRNGQQMRAMLIGTDLQSPIICASFTKVERVSSTLTLGILESDHLIQQAASTKIVSAKFQSGETMKTGRVIQGRFLHGQSLTKIECYYNDL